MITKFFTGQVKDIKAAFRKELLIVGVVFFFLSLFSAPTNFLFHFVSYPFPPDNPVSNRRRQQIIDLWHVIWLFGSIVILFCFIERYPVLALLPLLKLLDLFYTLLMIIMFNRWSKGTIRPLLHLALHYVQVVVAYACLFLGSKHLCGEALFLVHGCRRYLSVGDALYLSLITAATVGYGDVIPLIPSDVQGRFWCQPTFYVGIEILSAIGLTVLFIPYFVNAANKPT